MRVPQFPKSDDARVEDAVDEAMKEFDRRWHPVVGPSTEMRDDLADALAVKGIDLMTAYSIYQTELPVLRAWVRLYGEISARRALASAEQKLIDVGEA